MGLKVSRREAAALRKKERCDPMEQSIASRRDFSSPDYANSILDHDRSDGWNCGVDLRPGPKSIVAPDDQRGRRPMTREFHSAIR